MLSLTVDLKSNVPFTIIFNLHYPFTSDLCSSLVKLTNSVQLANRLCRAGIESAITFFFSPPLCLTPLEPNSHGGLYQTRLQISFPDLASASERVNRGPSRTVGVKIWNGDRVHQEKRVDLFSHRPDRVFSPKSHRCRFSALGVRLWV